MTLWSGLGYYRRARNLHAAARTIQELHGGKLPTDLSGLMSLPGIGRSTAGAILACGSDISAPILDGNVKRVLCRLHALELPNERTLWELATEYTPSASCADYTQAILDFGATWCTKANPKCDKCPFALDCEANQTNRVAELPIAKPRSRQALTEMRAYLCMSKDSCVMLSKQSDGALWTNTWVVPYTTAGERLATIEPNHAWVSKATASRELPSFDHNLSHIRFHVKPILVEFEFRSAEAALAEGHQWYPLKGEEINLALPTITVKLLRILNAHLNPDE